MSTKKKILLGIVVVLIGAGTYVGLNWTSVMTAFMTASIDPTAHAQIKALGGAPHATRYKQGEGERGDESPLTLAQGLDLKPNDKVISDGEDTRLVLALDDHNTLELRAADFILKSLFGDDSDTFRVNVEEGTLHLTLGGLAGRRAAVVDTNKNRVDVTSDTADVYLVVTSFEGTLQVFVKAGAVTLTNSRSDPPKVQPLTAGQSAEVDEDGAISLGDASAAWIKELTR